MGINPPKQGLGYHSRVPGKNLQFQIHPFKPPISRLYYWDDRDGVAFSGWWFGPKIGGDQAAFGVGEVGWGLGEDKPSLN